MLPSSPRARRRLGWTGAVLVAALAAGVTVSLLPRAKTVRDTLTPGPVVKHEREIEVTPEMRRGINATLDKFIPAAVLGRDPGLAWKLAGPSLRGGTTRADWLRGETPVWRYPVRNLRIHDWEPLFAYRDRVAFDLLLQPRADARLGPIAVSVDMARKRGSWIVDSWYVAAVFNAPDEEPWVTGQADFTTEYSMNDHLKSPKFQQRKLAAGWIALPLALLGSIFIVPLALGARVLLRRRRAAG